MRSIVMSLFVILGAAACVDDGGVTGEPAEKGAFDVQHSEAMVPEGVASEIGGPFQGCRRTGCSGQVCANQTVYTTCEWRDEYACYDGASCAMQADGQCGWTETPELLACLASGGGVAM